MSQSISERSDQNATSPSKQPYETPELRSLGDVRDLTLGGSPGTGDSGNPSLQQF
ncbi:MAG: lasso RiPP family leader peptide-containing protein [Xanthomonadales bacterium]|nr:lasso RiPP family leader peptide-containing protein [Xanthomonadales bacterium]